MTNANKLALAVFRLGTELAASITRLVELEHRCFIARKSGLRGLRAIVAAMERVDERLGLECQIQIRTRVRFQFSRHKSAGERETNAAARSQLPNAIPVPIANDS